MDGASCCLLAGANGAVQGIRKEHNSDWKLPFNLTVQGLAPAGAAVAPCIIRSRISSSMSYFSMAAMPCVRSQKRPMVVGGWSDDTESL
jgi:hypothetical protein